MTNMQQQQRTSFDEQVPLGAREFFGGQECTRCGDRWVGMQHREVTMPEWVPCSCPAPCESCDPEAAVEQGFGCICRWVSFQFVRLTDKEMDVALEERHLLLERASRDQVKELVAGGRRAGAILRELAAERHEEGP